MFHSSSHQVTIRIASYDGNWYILVHLPYAAKKFSPVKLWHYQVKENQIKVLVANEFQSLQTA